MIDLVAVYSPGDKKQSAYEHALVTVATAVGALLLIRAVDDPELSAALRDASLNHFGAAGT